MIVWKCPTCGQQLHATPDMAGQPFVCPNCQQSTTAPAMPPPIPDGAAPSGAVPPTAPVSMPAQLPKCQRLVYILLGIFLGTFGVHNFVAGYHQRGLIQLIVSLAGYALIFCTLGASALGPLAMAVWAIVEICTVTHDANGVRMN